MANYFGGGTPGSGNCACGETHSCFNTSLPCNCDENDEVWRVDEGFVTNKDELPIHSFYAGDTGTWNSIYNIFIIYDQIDELIRCYDNQNNGFHNTIEVAIMIMILFYVYS